MRPGLAFRGSGLFLLSRGPTFHLFPSLLLIFLIFFFYSLVVFLPIILAWVVLFDLSLLFGFLGHVPAQNGGMIFGLAIALIYSRGLAMTDALPSIGLEGAILMYHLTATVDG